MLEKLDHLFSTLIESVVSIFETTINTVEEVLSDIPETIGCIIQDSLVSVSDGLNRRTLAGSLLRFFLLWLGSVLSSFFVLLSGLPKALGSIICGIITGLLRVAGGLLSLNSLQLRAGLWDFTSSVLGALILVGGQTAILLQSILLMGRKKRQLKVREKQLFKKIFKNSLALQNIRIIESGIGLPLFPQCAFSFGNLVFLHNSRLSDHPGLLVHECTHTWQFQNVGARYLSDAIYVLIFDENPYDWRKGIRSGVDQWSDFNRESQAEFIQDLYLKGKIVGDNASKKPGAFYCSNERTKVGSFRVKNTEYTDFAHEAVETVRKGRSWRISSFIWG